MSDLDTRINEIKDPHARHFFVTWNERHDKREKEEKKLRTKVEYTNALRSLELLKKREFHYEEMFFEGKGYDWDFGVGLHEVLFHVNSEIKSLSRRIDDLLENNPEFRSIKTPTSYISGGELTGCEMTGVCEHTGNTGFYNSSCLGDSSSGEFQKTIFYRVTDHEERGRKIARIVGSLRT